MQSHSLHRGRLSAAGHHKIAIMSAAQHQLCGFCLVPQVSHVANQHAFFGVLPEPVMLVIIGQIGLSCSCQSTAAGKGMLR